MVKKVHTSIARHDKKQIEVILIGHEGHPEVEGTLGQLPKREIKLVSSRKDIGSISVKNETQLAYTTQTTLSMDETKDVIAALKEKYPHIQGPEKGDLCYATTNRQEAVTEISKQVDLLLIIGSANSSNSNRLRELGKKNGVKSYLIDSKNDIELEWFKDVSSVGISSGASAPEHLVTEVVDWLQAEFSPTQVKEVITKKENVKFQLPSILAK